MRKLFMLAMLVALSATAMSQEKDNIFSIKHDWSKYFGYSYQPAYPYGFSLAGGSFMSFGFADGDAAPLEVKAGQEYCRPTWSMRFGWVGYTFDKKVTGMGAISFRPYVALGMNFAKDSVLNASTGNFDVNGNTYFTMAPSIVVNFYMVHFSVGYEIVPACKQMNGLNFGVGISFPGANGNVSNKAKAATKKATTRATTKKVSKKR